MEKKEEVLHSKKRKRSKEEEKAEYRANQRSGSSLAHILGLIRQDAPAAEDNATEAKEETQLSSTESNPSEEASDGKQKRRVFGVWLSNDDVPEEIKGDYKVATSKPQQVEQVEPPKVNNYGPEFVKPRIVSPIAY